MSCKRHELKGGRGLRRPNSTRRTHSKFQCQAERTVPIASNPFALGLQAPVADVTPSSSPFATATRGCGEEALHPFSSHESKPQRTVPIASNPFARGLLAPMSGTVPGSSPFAALVRSVETSTLESGSKALSPRQTLHVIESPFAPGSNAPCAGLHSTLRSFDGAVQVPILNLVEALVEAGDYKSSTYVDELTCAKTAEATLEASTKGCFKTSPSPSIAQVHNPNAADSCEDFSLLQAGEPVSEVAIALDTFQKLVDAAAIPVPDDEAWISENFGRGENTSIASCKGKGKKGPPMPQNIGGGASVSKSDGKSCNEPNGSRSRRPITPLGRRFHWQGLSADRVRGTVFDENCDSMKPHALNLEAIQKLFTHAQEEKQESSASTTCSTPRHVFSQQRAQHLSIVLRRVLGSSSCDKEIESLARDLEAVELSSPMADLLLQRDSESLELLATALPNSDEAALLQAAALDPNLRPVPEKLVLPLVRIPRPAERLRALRLGSQAEALASVLLQRIHRLKTAGAALKASEALRGLLQAVVQLGRWINGSDADRECGFTLPSALGKLRQFRALRGNREISLLHVVALTAARGDPTVVGELGKRLRQDLDGLSDAAREDLGQLAEAVTGFRAEAIWLEAEASTKREADSHASAYFYDQDVRERMLAIYRNELVGRAEALEAAWKSARAELRGVLAFFAEPLAEKPGVESATHSDKAIEHLFQTVDDFQAEMLKAADQVSKYPQRFRAVLA
eukprot:TRINITY_DN27123_c0_g1_i1.p1 TRINITY_DN27123_c0_g1~~TRINITY_DN27123_c0_g1_i1.p1  ORF type:complete len:742 (+),score=110.47 TRINITY_DN27123_c0_g1_i1:58-2283(+)